MPDTSPRIAPWLLVAAALVALISVVAVVVVRPLPTQPYSAFLDAAAAGRVTEVVQSGMQLDVTSTDGRYTVETPSVLTDVFGDLQRAVGAGPLPLFSAVPAPDVSLPGPGAIIAVNLVLMVGLLALAVFLLRRRPGPTT